MADLVARRLTDADWPEFSRILFEAFLADLTDAERDREHTPWEPARSLGVCDGVRMLGVGGILTREITVPGPTRVPAAAVTYVGVLPDARRRGVLGTLMRTQLDGLHEAAAESIAVLWASQPGIYGRFGYAVASRAAVVTVPAGSSFGSPFEHRAGFDGRVAMVDADAAAAPMRAVHHAVCEHRVGWLSRPESSWRFWLADIAAARDGASAFRYVLHHGADGPDGYAVFRIAPGEQTTGPGQRIAVHELVATTPGAVVGLWRMLLDLDLVGSVSYPNLALDDPLLVLLSNPRGVVTGVRDQLWARLVDLDRALAGRRYAAPGTLVLDVTDTFCAWNAGRWRLDVDGDGAADVSRSTAPADLRCDITALGAAYLGGTRLTALASAGRVQELRPGAVLAASRAFAGDGEPYCAEVF